MYSFIKKLWPVLRLLLIAVAGFFIIFITFVHIQSSGVSVQGIGVPSRSEVGSFVMKLIFGMFILSALILEPMGRAARNRRLAAQDFEWFKKLNPSQVKDGHVTCGCGSTRIQVHRLMGGTYLRSHYCATCGKTLYYSREG